MVGSGVLTGAGVDMSVPKAPNEYEAARLANIQRNEAALADLGLLEIKSSMRKQPRERSTREVVPVVPREKSSRERKVIPIDLGILEEPRHNPDDYVPQKLGSHLVNSTTIRIGNPDALMRMAEKRQRDDDEEDSPPGAEREKRPYRRAAPEDCRFKCPVPGCFKAYSTSCGLYQHKRAHHPELINSRKLQPAPPLKTFDVTVPEGAGPGQELAVTLDGQPFTVTVPEGLEPGEIFPVTMPDHSAEYSDPLGGAEREGPPRGPGRPTSRPATFGCPAPGCTKVYSSSCGLYRAPAAGSNPHREYSQQGRCSATHALTRPPSSVSVQSTSAPNIPG